MIAEIKISSELKLKADSLQWTLYHNKGINDSGEVVWKAIGYYTSLAWALQCIADKQFRTCDSLQTVLSEIQKMYDKIDEIFPEGNDLVNYLRDNEKPSGKEEAEDLGDLLS